MCDVVGGGYCEEVVVFLGKKLRRISWIVSINRVLSGNVFWMCFSVFFVIKGRM